jgi:collagen type I/II/III/V/XI/XXIV/XXVII alpha
MRLAILFGVTLSAAMATGIGAQTPPSPGTAAQPANSQIQISLTGCLKSGNNSGTGAGASSSAGKAGSRSGSGFILTDAKSSATSPATSAPGEASTPASGAPQAGTGGSSKTSYELIGGDQSDLSRYVNSLVEVRGTISKDSSASTATVGATGATGATGAGATATRESSVVVNVPTIRVASVRQIASSCTP